MFSEEEYCYVKFVWRYVILEQRCKQSSTQATTRSGLLGRTNGSSVLSGLQHFHFPSQKINVIVMFQEHHGVVADTYFYNLSCT